MAKGWILSYKPGLLREVLALPAKQRYQVLTKIADLALDPHADAHTKMRLKHMNNKLHRLRSTDYRVFYTYDDTHVSLLALRLRNEETYDTEVDPEFLGAGDVDTTIEQPGQPSWEQWMQPSAPKSTPFPEPITPELLVALRVPAVFHARLLEIGSQETLFECPAVPDEYLLAIDEHMFVKPVATRLDQPDLIGSGVDDLLRYASGELDDFLLKLSPEQEKYVNWAIDAAGPTLVKGGPGSGKSTVALYRVREVLSVLRANGVPRPRILFTTYTVPLVNASRQLLRTLLGDDDLGSVDVRNYDKLIREILAGAGRRPKFAREPQERQAFRDAFQAVVFDGSNADQASQRSSVDKLGVDYLRDEVKSVIHGRDLRTLGEYEAAPRVGRRIPLSTPQRRAVWAVCEAFERRLTQKGLRTWQQVRAEAADLVAAGRSSVRQYDAVIIDEAQDLDPTVLRILVNLCAAPNRLFVTADAQQAIYRSGFNWSDVHEDLRFQGRTGVLRANHRSTRQIAEAAGSYLAAGADDEVEVETQTFTHDGLLPVVRRVPDQASEMALLARYLKGAARDRRLTMGACAVLVPTNDGGRAVARGISEAGVEAVFQDSQAVDLTVKQVKVLTLAASKGLEFPIVAIAGLQIPAYPFVPPAAPLQMVVEILAKERRTIFVAMTRAMRTLLVLLPQDENSLFEGFDAALWNAE
jgi:superfamily I DNA/RNA helicase/mRNA-degrading endonuclease RelE of RelBE toxin-antitoxin system